MLQETTRLNAVPMRSWNWLKVNDTTLQTPPPQRKRYARKLEDESTENAVILPLLFASSWQYADKTPVRMGVDWEDYINHNANFPFEIHIKGEERVTLDLPLTEERPVLIDDLALIIEDGGSLLLNYSGSGWHAGRTRALVRAGAKAKIFCLQNFEATTQSSYALSIGVEEGASVEVVMIEMGASQSVSNLNIELWGDEASANVQTLYFGTMQRELDLNYRIAFHGRASNAEMITDGVLMDRSQKTYRGTLDFVSGCKGAVGAEEENTILLSPTVKHLTMPILLCGEDEVEGSHAASTGRIDENKLFYLMTRGLSEVEAKKMIVEAAFGPAIARLEDETLAETLMEQLRKGLEDAEALS